MSLFRTRAQTPVTERGAFMPRGALGLLGPSQSGVEVTLDSALRSAAVWACQRVLVSTVAKMPVLQVRYVGSALEKTQSQFPVVARPSGRMSRRQWVAQLMRSTVSSGNIYGLIVATDPNTGSPTQIETVNPADVRWMFKDGTEVPFVSGRPMSIWNPATKQGDLWHVPASQFLTPGSRVAMSPVEYARTAIGTGIAAENFTANFFADGYNPTAIAYVDADIDQFQAEMIKDRIESMRRDRRPGVFGKDIKIEHQSVNPSDSQFIDTMRFEVEQACRFWGVPPSMVYAAVSGQSVTYANVSQNDLQYLKYSIENWIVDLEDAWSDLITRPQFVKFDVDSALRMDALGREQVNALKLANRTASVNELRRLANEPVWEDPKFNEPGLPVSPAPMGV